MKTTCPRCRFDSTLDRVERVMYEEGFTRATWETVRWSLAQQMRREIRMNAMPTGHVLCPKCQARGQADDAAYAAARIQGEAMEV
jgi:hypothetical protein